MSAFAVRLVASFGAGVVSFAAPCVLPLLPAYVGVLGLGGGADGHRSARRATGSLGFVVGLACTFALFGGAAARGVRTVGSQRAVEVTGGLVMALCGLAATGLIGWIGHRVALRTGRRTARRTGRRTGRRWLQQGLGPGAAFRRGTAALLQVAAAVPTPVRALAVGAAFGAGFSPCVGPWLAAALGTAALEGSAWHGAALLASFAFGLGVPFVVAGLLLSQLDAKAGAWRPRLVHWSRRAERVAGVVLLVAALAVLRGDATALIDPVATVTAGVF